MKITLQFLKEQGAGELSIQCFENFCLYREFEPVELVKQGFDTGMLEYFNYALVYKSIDTLQELKDVVDYCIKHGDRKEDIGRTFEFCHEIYKQDLDFCKKTMHFYLSKAYLVCEYDYILRNYNEVLVLLPELHKTLKNYAEVQAYLKIIINNT